MRNHMPQWLPRSQQQAEADTVPGLVADSDTAPRTPTEPGGLGDLIPDINDCVTCQRPMDEVPREPRSGWPSS
eukprot:2311253-Alexandrium_andersonii.AAC.1